MFEALVVQHVVRYCHGEELGTFYSFIYDADRDCYIRANSDYAPGNAVWLFTKKATTLTLRGTSVETTGVILSKGWNIVSPLYSEKGTAVANPGLDDVWYWTPAGYSKLLPGENAKPGTVYLIYSDETQVIWK